jgi:CubicO group peptidase (beta-lactamase class C family)
VSSARDLLALGRWVLVNGATSPSVLSQTTMRSLWKGCSDGWFEGRSASWTIGSWRLGGPGDFRGERSLCSSGAAGTCMWIDPDAQLVAVFLSASWLRSDHQIFGQAINGIFGCIR